MSGTPYELTLRGTGKVEEVVGPSIEMTVPGRTPEPPPVPRESAKVWDLVIADMRERDRWGTEKYGTPLQVENGRDHLVDAYQEALDLAVYLRAEIARRRGEVVS